MARQINIVTLGCSKNVVDSEHLAAQLGARVGEQLGASPQDGWEIVFDSDSTDAKVVIINTCGFIGDAKEESVNTILRFAAAKEAGDIERLYVMGCLSERYRDELRAEIPEVDAWFGTRDWDGLLPLLRGQYRAERRTERTLSTPPHYAYLKISEGCDRGCGFCAIPLIRGRHASVPIPELVEEATRLAQMGVRELIVIAQDTTYYGLDLYGERKLAQLLRELAKVEGIAWIRLHYAYPAGFPREVIELMRQEPKLCHYLDIPLQHIGDQMLRAMRRGHTRAETMALIAQLRQAVPDIALRTTLLVGYPGETERDFEELLEFVRTVRFDRLGVFPYSQEEGTYSARELPDDVPQDIKTQRVERLMAVQQAISRELNEGLVGRELCVILDRQEGQFWVGRTPYDSPEVDQEVLIHTKKSLASLKAGEFVRALITRAEEYDLYGQLVGG